jgi:hypothetical protein
MSQGLERLRLFIPRKIANLWAYKWILHYGNAASHTALPVKRFLVKK